ncbi:response regulator transcription factor, partial [bacterium]
MEPTTAEPRLLLIDDDAELCDLISQYLGSRGFHLDIEESGEDGLKRAEGGSYDLLILDVMLPGIDGFEVLRQIRAAQINLPVVMLTAHGDEIDRIVGLELGADDYLPKPFNPRELLARIRAVLRRIPETPATPPPAAEPSPPEVRTPPPRQTIGDMELDVAARALRCSGEAIELTATEFDLFAVLFREAGRVVPRDELSREALGRRLL